MPLTIVYRAETLTSASAKKAIARYGVGAPMVVFPEDGAHKRDWSHLEGVGRGFHAVECASESGTREVLEALQQDGAVEHCYVAPPREPLPRPRRPQRGRLPGSSAAGANWPDIIRLPSARLLPQWQKIAHEVSVSIVDTGADVTHPALRHIAFDDHLLNAPVQLDPEGHGTHVAGLIAARANGGWSLEGIAARCSRTVVHRGLRRRAGYRSVEYYRSLGAATKARVVNLSLGERDEDDLESRLIDHALHRRQCIIVAAMGNGGEIDPDQLFYPACLPGVIAVGAVDADGQVAPISSLGAHMTIAAPGVEILSTVPTYAVSDLRATVQPAGAMMSGTSMAAPMVTGAIALMLGIDPTLTLPAVTKKLHETARQGGLLPILDLEALLRSF